MRGHERERAVVRPRGAMDNVRVTLDDLRGFAVSRSLFKPLTLARVIERLGFVQDPNVP